MDTRVAVIMGGPGQEHDVSCRSGANIVKVLRAKCSVIEVLVKSTGSWIIDGEEMHTLGAALDKLKQSVDIVFPIIHGTFGEDGTLQALLDASNIPYIGSKVAASSIAMDKCRTKYIYIANNLPTPAFSEFTPETKKEVEGFVQAHYPVVVKLNASGSSFGVSFPKSKEAAIQEVSNFLVQGATVLVEEVVNGREFTCGVLEGEDGPYALPVTEIQPAENLEFFNYEAKYQQGGASEITPAEISDELRLKIQALALAAHRVLGCRDVSRTDFLLDEGSPVLLETNTLPGMTDTSLLPQAAAAMDISFETLIEALVKRRLPKLSRVQGRYVKERTTSTF